MVGADTAWPDLLRGLRRAGGFSQAEWSALLAAAAPPGSAAAWSTDSIGRWERGDHPPNAATLDAIAAVCAQKGLFAAMGIDERLLRTKLAQANLALPGARPAQSPQTGWRSDQLEVPGSPRAPRPWERHHNLPVELTSFVGREDALAAVRQRLQTAHLVTITGPPGVGKTRLALRLAAESLDAFVDGVWLVELAALADPSLVPHAAAAAVGVLEQPQQPLAVTLAAALAGRQVLLVLDNCEHLLAACAELASTLLRSCPELRVLVTSRQALGTAGEVVWPAPPLQVPELLESALAEPVAQAEATRLFVERARAVNPRFELTAGNAAAVVRVCRQLDGLPLPIELAAARINALGVEQIAARLHDRFALLTGGSRTGVPHHETLRAAVDWSYDLLAEPERVLLRRLAVFAGSFTLEGVEGVAAGEGIEPRAVLDLLASLVAHSLVAVEERDGAVRYRLLDTLRQYGEERLRAADEEVALRSRHLAWYAARMEEGEPQFWGPRQPGWLAQLEAEYANLRAALEWSQREVGQARIGLRLAAATWRYWDMRGHLSEGRALLQPLLALAPEPTQARVQVLITVSRLVFLQGDIAEGRTSLEEAWSLAAEIGYTFGLHVACCGLGVLACQDGDVAGARAMFELALADARRTGDSFNSAQALIMIGELACARGDYEQSTALLTEGLTIARDRGDPWVTSWTLFDLGYLALLEGEHERAWELQQESLRLRWEIGDVFLAALSLDGLGWVAAAQGRFERAVRLLAAAEAVRGRVGGQLWPQYAPNHEHAVGAARAALGDISFAAACQEVRALSMDQAIAEALFPQNHVR